MTETDSAAPAVLRFPCSSLHKGRRGVAPARATTTSAAERPPSSGSRWRKRSACGATSCCRRLRSTWTYSIRLGWVPCASLAAGMSNRSGGCSMRRRPCQLQHRHPPRNAPHATHVCRVQRSTKISARGTACRRCADLAGRITIAGGGPLESGLSRLATAAATGARPSRTSKPELVPPKQRHHQRSSGGRAKAGSDCDVSSGRLADC